MDGGELDPVDDDLMTAYARGDQAAFATLYARHRDALYGYLFRHLQDRSLCDELFQDVWQKLIHSRSSFHPQGQFKAWLMRIAQHRLEDHWRANKIRPATPIDAQERIEALSDQQTPETVASAFGQRRALRMAMAELPNEQRTVLLMRLEQELTLEEIAELTGATRETVKSRLRYAMDKLRTRMQA